MTRTASSTLLVALGLVSLIGCDRGAPAASDGAADIAMTELSVDQAAALVTAKKITAVDANGTDTRSEFGTLPGAVLLTSSSGYDMSELPADKDAKLMFYCSSTFCTSAPQAAKRAASAGYTDVCVMPKGIKGWTAAGNPVDKADAAKRG